MQAQEIHLQDYFNVLYKRRWVVVIAFLAVLGITAYYALSQPPIYRSTATIRIDIRAVDFGQGVGIGVRSVTHGFDYYERIFNTGLFRDRVAGTLAQRLQGEEILETEEQSIAALVGGNLSLTEIGPGFLNVAATASEPDLAHQLAQVASELFEERCRELELADSKDVTTYLDEQLAVMKDLLAESERDLQQFIQNTGMVVTEDKGGVHGELLRMQSELENIRRTKELAEVSLRAYRIKRDQLSQQMNTAERSDSPELVQLRKTLSELEERKNRLASELGETASEVLVLNGQIEQIINEIKDMQLAKAQMSFRPKGRSPEDRAMLDNAQAQIISEELNLFVLDIKEKYYREQIDAFKRKHPDLLENTLEVNKLLQSKRLNEEAYNFLFQEKEKLRIRAATQTGGIKIVDPARKPIAPEPSQATRNLIFGGLLGLALGVAGAFLFEYMDTSIKSGDEISRYLDVPVLGEIPRIRQANNTKVGLLTGFLRSNGRVPGTNRGFSYDSKLVLHFSPKEPVPESYRALRTNLQFAFLDESLRAFVVSSPSASEGKSLTVANLGIGMAESGKSVLLVDSDLRRPVLHKVFGLNRKPGLTDVLVEESDSTGVIQPTATERLSVLTAGRSSPNPGELLNSHRMNELIEEMKALADVVLFDSPPIIAAVDASILTTKTQGVLMVVQMEATKREDVLYAHEQVTRIGGRVLGVVLNDINVYRRYGYYYNQKYYYQKHYYGTESGDYE